MLKTSIGAAAAALCVAGLFSFSGMGAASAESVMKQCGAEWKAAKAAGTTNGQTWKEFLAACKQKNEGGATPAAASTPMASPTPVFTPTPTPTPTKTAPMKPPVPKASAAPSGAGEFASEGEAKAKCPSDTVVWVNTKSHKYHYSGHKSYGTTKHGAYMCEADANAAGDVAAKGEKTK